MPATALQSRHAIDLSKPEFQSMSREFRVDRAGIDKDARTVPLSFASENPVARWFGNEILDISADACDLTRLNNGGAVLVNHNWDDQVGVVLESSIDLATKKARCVAKFSRSDRGDEIFQDILDGIRSLVSVGYIVRKMVLQSVDGDVETHRVTDWLPFEVSVVAVPADTSVGIGRSQPTASVVVNVTQSTPEKPNSTRESPALTMPPEVTTEHVTKTAPVVAAGVDHLARMKEINGAAKVLITRHPAHAEAIRDLVSKCGETGDTIDAFNRTVLNDILATQRTLAPVTQSPDAGKAGMDRKQIAKYSILRAIRAIVENKPLDGLEGEMNTELTRKLERAPKGFFLPDEIVARDRRARQLLAGSPTDGGYTVDSDVLSAEFIQLLRNQTKVIGLGARYISGLQGDISIPRQVSGATAYWVSETGSITQSNAKFGQVVGKPRRIGTSVPYTKQFLAQTSLDAESFVTNDSDDSISVELDRVAINGSGGAQPLGILNLAAADRSTSVHFGGAATWANYVKFWSNVAANNAVLGNPAYLTTPAAAAKAMTIQKFATYGDPIWSDASKIGVFRADYSNQFPAAPVADQVIFGDFTQMLFLEWAGRDVVVDPYFGKKEGTVEITIQRLIDMVIRRGQSFAISDDSGAQ